jgi:uncharacterized HAD superfamily protein
MRSVIDLDDVLIDLHKAFINYAETNLGIVIDLSLHDHFGFYRAYGISDQEFLDIVQHDDLIKLIKPFETSRQAMLRLKSNDIKLDIVTARGYMRDGYNRTLAIVEACHIPFDTLNIVPQGKKKSDCYKMFDKKIALLVDDANHNIDDAINSGLVEKIYLINRSWNESYVTKGTKVRRTNSLLDAVVAFERSLSNSLSY